MGRRELPRRRIESFGQVAAIVGGILLMALGAVWTVVCFGTLVFGGLDLFAPVASGMSAQGPVILGLAVAGLGVVGIGRAVADSARRAPRS
ncbi:hypothetical protein IWX81_000397 [Salinibacterium sp. CAN_S4]|uniref:hypothetical protein n=1 Tax=Salinibacterium sp. CAN_S4 TaxID=2787727 RepID=UPI0018EF82AA